MPEYLKNECDQIIYIDSDTLVVGSLDALLESTQETIISAVKDCDCDIHVDRLNLPLKKYFNSGVIVINIPKWLEFNVTQKALMLLSEKTFLYPDQEVLNIILNDKFSYLENRYNYQIQLGNYIERQKEKDKDAVIIHYISSCKPWFLLYQTQLYRQYLNKTPWRKTQTIFAPNGKAIRKYANEIKKFEKITSYKLKILYRLYKLMGEIILKVDNKNIM